MEDIDEVEEVLARIPPTPTPTAPRERPPNSNSSVNPGPDPDCERGGGQDVYEHHLWMSTAQRRTML